MLRAGRTLLWQAPARVRVLGWDGRVLYDASAAAGAQRELPGAAWHALRAHTARLVVTR